MCTVVTLRRPGHPWPLLLAANRDEMGDRPWRSPARHWNDRPDVVAGLDELAGGSWLGVNEAGVVAAILNRRNSLGPAPGMRSRGELVLDALDHADAAVAAAALGELAAQAYRSFNLVIADDRDAFWLRGGGPEGPEQPRVAEIPIGLSMLTASDLDDAADPRVAFNLPRWRRATTPDPAQADWAAWEALLASREHAGDPRGAMCFHLASGFGTVSSALIALPDRAGPPPHKPRFRFADGHPESIRWRDVTL